MKHIRGPISHNITFDGIDVPQSTKSRLIQTVNQLVGEFLYANQMLYQVHKGNPCEAAARDGIRRAFLQAEVLQRTISVIGDFNGYDDTLSYMEKWTLAVHDFLAKCGSNLTMGEGMEEVAQFVGSNHKPCWR